MNSTGFKYTALLKKLSKTLPWLHFTGACLIFVLLYLFTAIHSQLGQEISAGESPGFAWLGIHIFGFMGLAGAYLILVGGLQHAWVRLNHNQYAGALKIPVRIQFLCVGLLAPAVFNDWRNLIPALTFLLLASILMQGYAVLWYQQFNNRDDPCRLRQRESHPLLFLVLLFFLNVVVAQLDPSWYRLKEYMYLNSSVEVVLRKLIPAVFAGTTGLWFGIVTLAIIALTAFLQTKLDQKASLKGLSFFLPFFLLSGFYTVITLSALTYAIEWQVNTLGLRPAVFSMAFVLSAVSGALLSITYSRILDYLPRDRKLSPAGLICVSFGVLFICPLFWLVTSKPYRRSLWIFLILSTLLLCGFVAYLLLYGDLFNPWFTAFSYLKSILLKILTLVVAGALVLVFEEVKSAEKTRSSGFGRYWAVMAVVFFLGFFPFGILNKYPAAKTTILQFSDLTRVEAAYARELSGLLKLDSWVRLGQNPDFNPQPHPWPQPWKLAKTHPSLLPEDFNLMVIVVDALRGDAFHSAGYHRNLTPFLDQWAREEAVSFRRAYSQGGGSFAAFPFLVAGRSRFDLYGPDLYRENLFLKIAQAEGIRRYMVMQGFGPRSIFAPKSSVIELTIPRAVTDRRTATADEVFNSAREAITKITAGERFLCFLHLMDVHNDLWEKPGGKNFGETPRDLYDHNLAYLDSSFERFINWLKANHIYEKTVILFTSDHGEQFWEHGASLHGHTLYEEEIRIPAILFVPEIQRRFEDVPVIAADMVPTIADLAGYSIDPPYDDPRMGISLVPLILNDERDRYLKRDVVGRASFKRRYFLFRNWQWKLIYFAELDLLQLFNVKQDPMEKKNLIEEKPRLAAELEQQLLGCLKQVEGKTYRPLLTQSSPNADLYVKAANR
jgi:glucan phosphoethanolaminetransferase (alkaline phosphatase superfamily)